MKGNATRLENVVIDDTEAIALVKKVKTEAREHKEEYEKMVVNLAGAVLIRFYHKNNLK